MTRDTEKTERYLRELTIPTCESLEHQRRLRNQVLGRLAGSDRVPRRTWTVAGLIVGVLCAGALVAQVAVQARRYFFEGRAQDGTYRFSSETQTLYNGERTSPDGGAKGMTVGRREVVSIGSEEMDAQGIAQVQRDLEEIHLLREQKAGEVMGVTDTEVNGHRMARAYQVKYVLADGRVQTMGEAGLDKGERQTPAEIENQQEQIAQLRQEGRREVTTVIETEVSGQVNRTLICLYVLPDGREVTIGEGDPTAGTSAPTLTPAQQQELSRLAGLKAGARLESIERRLFDREFTLERYSYELSDGTVAIRSEGQPTGFKRTLTEGDWKELGAMLKSGTGELLGQYEQEVMGQVFRFEKRRYLLSDGTEVIQSRGVPGTGN